LNIALDQPGEVLGLVPPELGDCCASSLRSSGDSFPGIVIGCDGWDIGKLVLVMWLSNFSSTLRHPKYLVFWLILPQHTNISKMNLIFQKE
jgi:hypothetical protein